MDPRFATLYSYNANLTISRELGANFVLSAGYLYTSGSHLPVYRNINLVPTGATLADARPIFSTTSRVYPGVANVLSAESVGKSNYNGLNLMLQKRFSKGYELIATYTWSHAIDDAPEQNNIDSGAAFLSDPTEPPARPRELPDGQAPSFNMTGVFLPEVHIANHAANYLANHNRLSLGVVASSGDLFNIGSNLNLNGDPTDPAGVPASGLCRTEHGRAANQFELFARYSRLFPITERKNFEFLAESTNLLNRMNPIA